MGMPLEGNYALCPQDEERDSSSARLMSALASLNQISSIINHFEPGDSTNVEATLHLIVESAIKVVPGSSAVMYIYDQAQHAFDLTLRVSAGEKASLASDDEPRPNGMGMRAISQLSRVLSYEERDLDIHPVKVDLGAKAVVCFPLVVAEQIVGALYVYLHEERRFSQVELLMLDNFVNQAAMAIYHARRVASVQRDLARKEDEAVRLHRAGLLISSRLSLKETLESILQMALEVTNAQYGSFRLVDRSGEHLIPVAVAGEHLSRSMMKNMPINSTSVMSWVAQHRQPLCISDLQVEPWASIYYPLDPDLEMRSELVVPLIGASGRLEGVLNLESPVAGTFGEQDSHLLQGLATQAVIAIQEVLLLDALQEVAERLLTEPCQQVLERLTELACDLLNAAASAVWILEDDWLVLREASAGHQHGEHVPLHDSLIGQAILRRGPVVSDDVQVDPLFNRPDLAHAQGWRRALVVPLLASAGDDRKPVGAFSVYSVEPEPGHFTESDRDRKVLMTLAHYAALAVQNAARQEALRAARDQRTVAETFAALGDIAANLLHQLNNKVGTIPVRVQGIQDKCRPALEADPYLSANLAEIEKSAHEAMDAVRENMALLHPIRLVPINLVPCVMDAIATADLPLGVRVRTEELGNLPPVVAGKRSLTLVFINLLENACEAMGGDGVITIRGAICSDWVEILVSDTGPGIASEVQGLIFEPNFSGLASARTGKLGFGLWWVKSLMTRLGGSVAVESDGEHGTTFRLRLPHVEEDLSNGQEKG
jgi:GAF domain-containing protein